MKHWYLSTITKKAPELAKKYGLGLEIAESCTAWNLDENRRETEEKIREYRCVTGSFLVHGPFNELFPCAIDPKARELARFRYTQTLEAAAQWGAPKVILHGGYQPFAYYPEWYVEQSVAFWQEFVEKIPDGMEIVLENVLETQPESLLSIVSRVDSPKLGLCLDVGHVNAYSDIPPERWLRCWASRISHFHIHNNDGAWDTHSELEQGSIPMEEFLPLARELCPRATMTLELMDGEESLHYLERLDLLKDNEEEQYDA